MANLSANRSSHRGIEIDRRTSRAVCEGIGERLRDQMKPTASLPHHLQELMNRFREIEDAPSIIPDAGMNRRR